MNVPAGFEPIRIGGDFIGTTGPLYLRETEGRVQLGFYVERRHTNGMLICHGGMMATFCDMLLPISARRLAQGMGDTFLPTVSLQVDYLAPARVDAWVEGEAQVLRATRNLVFMQGIVKADGATAARASGILRVGPAFADAAAHR